MRLAAVPSRKTVQEKASVDVAAEQSGDDDDAKETEGKEDQLGDNSGTD